MFSNSTSLYFRVQAAGTVFSDGGFGDGLPFVTAFLDCDLDGRYGFAEDVNVIYDFQNDTVTLEQSGTSLVMYSDGSFSENPADDLTNLEWQITLSDLPTDSGCLETFRARFNLSDSVSGDLAPNDNANGPVWDVEANQVQ
ncbi:MAG: hypothetical protein F6K39_31530 [Okeania sp. SIO3B3]|nr:hypothetical protein [Okeania sp. SIO3B3]